MEFELSKDEMDTAYHCLRAVTYGPFIEDSEFEARVGASRSELRRIAGDWPAPEKLTQGSRTTAAILGCLNEVCHGIRFSEQEWQFWLPESLAQVRSVYRKWDAFARGGQANGIPTGSQDKRNL